MRRQVRGDILVFLNNDTEIDDAGWLTEIWSRGADQVGALARGFASG
jgi:hypothetical protein